MSGMTGGIVVVSAIASAVAFGFVYGRFRDSRLMDFLPLVYGILLTLVAVLWTTPWFVGAAAGALALTVAAPAIQLGFRLSGNRVWVLPPEGELIKTVAEFRTKDASAGVTESAKLSDETSEEKPQPVDPDKPFSSEIDLDDKPETKE